MASKAAAALSRIREMDKKYKSKQEKRYSITSESSKSIDIEKPQKLLKPQLNIKMPDPYEDYMNVNTSSESQKCSVPIKIIYELPKKLSNSNDNSENNNNLEGHETPSDKITINNENRSRKDETNDSISEILEDTQSLSQISIKSTKSQKSTDERYYENSSLNLLTINETSKSDKKINTEEEEEEGTEEEEKEAEKVEKGEQEENNKKENLDSENKNSFVHYSDESFESSSSKTNNSQSTEISEQLQSKINSEKISTKELTIFSKNETNTSNDIVSDHSNISHNELQEPEEKLSTSTKNSISSNTYNDSIDNKQSSNESRSKNEKIDNKDDDNKSVKTTEKISNESEITPEYLNEQQIVSSESTSQARVILNQKSNENKSKKSDDTIEDIKPSRQISSSSSLSPSKSSQITKPKDPKKIGTRHKRKYVCDKPNVKYCSSAMINYVKKMREEQQKLHILPSQMICSDKIKIQSIKPLEFPKILNFVQNNNYKNPDLNLEILHNHLSNIRQWLKEQYLIYRENSEVAIHINKNYHPTTLNETKKIIYQLQSKTRAKYKNQ